jgi:hypothetical protein
METVSQALREEGTGANMGHVVEVVNGECNRIMKS